MRRTIGKTITNPNNLHLTNLIKSTSSYSTSSGGGRGRGRGGGGGGGGPVPFDFTKTPGKPDSDESKPDSTESRPSGLGHGRGKPIASDPILPSFSSFVSSIKPSQPATGRGRVTTESEPSRPATELPQPPPPTPPRKPIFVKIQELGEVTKLPTESTESSESNLPSLVFSALSGAGRGKPTKQSTPTPQIEEENRHVRARPRAGPREGAGRAEPGPAKPKLSREEAVKNAMMTLSRGGDGEEGGGGRGRGRGGRGRGGRGGRGMQKGWWREGGERRGRGRGGRGQDSEEGYGAGLYLGDNADGEKLAKKLGPEIMNKLVQGFEEMSGNVLPSPMEDVYLDALHTNFSIEFEPEYLMGEFDRNPDIDEKPPISLRDAFEQMKPFLMTYEGIQSQEEWEEAINEVMERVPLLKEIVDHYSGPNRVTAKKQQEELERVANSIPQSAPDTVKRFADRAVLSLKSNPGWGFDKKCQFMDKLVWEVSQQYK